MTEVGLRQVYSGKVRELYEVGHDRLLMVASDRVSVFDCVLPDEIPDKGRVLTGLSAWWFERTAGIVPNHVISVDPTDFPETAGRVGGRAMLVRAATPIRMECVVRGYLFGGAWKEYRERGTIGGQAAPPGLQEADRLFEPLFTPTTKAEAGHDEPLSPDEAVVLVGADLYRELRRLSIEVYEHGAAHVGRQGLVLADTKLEYGRLDGELMLIDELLTPDSSRYWPADAWQPGASPPSFDKQYVRDFMDSTGWNHEPPAPRMPTEVIAGTRARYVEAYERITGAPLDEWFGPEV